MFRDEYKYVSFDSLNMQSKLIPWKIDYFLIFSVYRGLISNKKKFNKSGILENTL